MSSHIMASDTFTKVAFANPLWCKTRVAFAANKQYNVNNRIEQRQKNENKQMEINDVVVAVVGFSSSNY